MKKIVGYSVISGFSIILAGSLSGCSGEQTTNEQAQGAFVVIEQLANGGYKILEEFPSAETRIVLKQLDGTEKVLTKEEMDALVAQEATKIDNGTSNLTNQNAQMSSGGMGLGEVILASMAGAMIGSWIGGKLFNNQHYQTQRQTAYKSPSTYSRSVDSFKKQGASSTKKAGKSGFFKSGSKTGQSVGS